MLAVLFGQHDRIRDLLGDVRQESGEPRGEAFDGLRRLLAAHETAEEIVLRPVSVQIMPRDQVTARNQEERHIIGLLAELERLDPLKAAFDLRFTPFEQLVAEHLSLEEAGEFPVIEAEVSERERLTMGRWIDRALVLGPNRAHPVPAGHPTAQRATAPFTALADHARDLFERSRATW